MHAVLWSMSYEEEEDACMSYEEEDACMSYEEEDACNTVEHLLAHVFYGFLSLLLPQDAFDGDCALEGRPASWGEVGGGEGQEGHNAHKSSSGKRTSYCMPVCMQEVRGSGRG